MITNHGANYAPVHPHARGEHLDSLIAIVGPLGSSPRLWGTQVTCLTHDTITVHPHACGEHIYPQRFLRPSARFIPTPVGNTFQTSFALLLLWRFIPTPVGNTKLGHSLSDLAAGYPHACGEHIPSSYSPNSVFRVIPTPVGNTLR